VGMEALQAVDGVEREFQVVRDRWRDFDFFYVHVKHTDSAGEDGDFERKVSLIEEVDRQIPSLIELDPDVLIVTGDHSTPALLKHHSWHPVPTLLWSKHCRQDNVEQFGERACMLGGLGPRFPATDLLPLAMANALRLEKFGA
jgi:2,3-bisphosphoglycerate-independent phosphoglycerate mutase